MSLKEIKEEVINNTPYDDYADFKFQIIVGSLHPDTIESIYLRIAERYAQQRVNEVLDKAAEEIESYKVDHFLEGAGDYREYNAGLDDAKEAILKLKNNEK